jgi:hypothetical protein
LVSLSSVQCREDSPHCWPARVEGPTETDATRLAIQVGC